MFYFDDYLKVWVRRLLTLKTSGVKFDMNICPSDEAGWNEVIEQRIRIQLMADTAPLREELPADVIQLMNGKLGEQISDTIRRFNYIGFYGLPQIRAAHEAWVEGGGFPINRIDELAPIKFVPMDDSWEYYMWHQGECQVVSVNHPVYQWGVIDHGIQTIVAMGYSRRQCQEWLEYRN